MPSLPKKITVDMATSRVLVDGVEFPWHIHEDGVTINNLGSRFSVPTVTLSLFAETIEVIPKEG